MPVPEDVSVGRPRATRHGARRSRHARKSRSVLRHTLMTAITFTLLLVLTMGGLAGYLYQKYN
ncbi:MAG: hypothetical protein ABI232_12485, partial [Jatrophihabitantaceae bacterium]